MSVSTTKPPGLEPPRFAADGAIDALSGRADFAGSGLDARAPTRLLSGLPEGVHIERLGISEAIAAVKDFLHSPGLAAPQGHE